MNIILNKALVLNISRSVTFFYAFDLYLHGELYSPFGDGKLCSNTLTSSLKTLDRTDPSMMEHERQKVLLLW